MGQKIQLLCFRKSVLEGVELRHVVQSILCALFAIQITVKLYVVLSCAASAIFHLSALLDK